MNYAAIIKDDTANGPGVRTSIFVTGCRNHCPGCFNQQLQDFNYGKKFDTDLEEDIINNFDKYHTGITLLGGDPLEPENAKVLLPFVHKFKQIYPDKTVWIYSGYTYEYLMELDMDDPRKMILRYADVLVDGLFIQSLRDITLKFRGSSNQRLVDLKRSSSLEVIEWQ